MYFEGFGYSTWSLIHKRLIYYAGGDMTSKNDAQKVNEIVGFDLGHGESSLALVTVHSSSGVPPITLEINGETSFITAVGDCPNRGILIGDDACTTENINDLNIGFKNFELDNENVRKPITQFASKIKEILIENKKINGYNQTGFIIGCPAGWSTEVREKYKKLFVDAGFNNVLIVPESRAAFIWAKQSVLEVSDEVLSGSVLVIDCGSSTTDFTYISNLKHLNVDFGHNKLGAGLIDEVILDYMINKSDANRSLLSIFTNHRTQRLKAKIQCRKVKEKYFSNEDRWTTQSINSIQRIHANPPKYFEISMSKYEMDEIINTTIPVLNNLSWPKYFQLVLTKVKEKLNENLPELVLLTGGASRMKFLAHICEEVFSKSTLKVPPGPEFAISKGLALCGRIDIITKSFEEEVNKIFEDNKIDRIIKEHIRELFEIIAINITEYLLFTITLKSFRDWRKGYLETLNDLKNEIQTRGQNWIQSVKGQENITNSVIEWLKKHMREFDELTEPICKKHKIPNSSLQPASFMIAHLNSIIDTSVDIDELPVLNAIQNTVRWIGALVIANILGGGGVALLMGGIVGWIIGLVIGIIAMIIGTDAAKDKLYTTNLPLRLRQFITDEKLKNKFKNNKEEAKEKFLNSLKNKPESDKQLAEKISAALKSSLLAESKKAAMYIS